MRRSERPDAFARDGDPPLAGEPQLGLAGRRPARAGVPPPAAPAPCAARAPRRSGSTGGASRGGGAWERWSTPDSTTVASTCQRGDLGGGGVRHRDHAGRVAGELAGAREAVPQPLVGGEVARAVLEREVVDGQHVGGAAAVRRAREPGSRPRRRRRRAGRSAGGRGSRRRRTPPGRRADGGAASRPRGSRPARGRGRTRASRRRETARRGRRAGASRSGRRRARTAARVRRRRSSQGAAYAPSHRVGGDAAAAGRPGPRLPARRAGSRARLPGALRPVPGRRHVHRRLRRARAPRGASPTAGPRPRSCSACIPTRARSGRCCRSIHTRWRRSTSAATTS